MRHSRIADLAASFPALLFALAVPRHGLDPALALARVIDGVGLAEVAAAAEHAPLPGNGDDIAGASVRAGRNAPPPGEEPTRVSMS
jgi:hypothetical protein